MLFEVFVHPSHGQQRMLRLIESHLRAAVRWPIRQKVDGLTEKWKSGREEDREGSEGSARSVTGRVSLPRGWKERSNGESQQRGYWQSVSKAAREDSGDIKKNVPKKRKKNPLFRGSAIMWGTDMWSGCWWWTAENSPERGSSMGQHRA